MALAASTFASNLLANAAHDQLSSMSEDQRRTTFAAFLAKSDERCKKVTRTFYQGSDRSGNSFWNVACTTGGAFVIQVNNDSVGSTRILSCGVLKAVNGGTCFTKFKN